MSTYPPLPSHIPTISFNKGEIMKLDNFLIAREFLGKSIQISGHPKELCKNQWKTYHLHKKLPSVFVATVNINKPIIYFFTFKYELIQLDISNIYKNEYKYEYITTVASLHAATDYFASLEFIQYHDNHIYFFTRQKCSKLNLTTLKITCVCEYWRLFYKSSENNVYTGDSLICQTICLTTTSEQRGLSRFDFNTNKWNYFIRAQLRVNICMNRLDSKHILLLNGIHSVTGLTNVFDNYKHGNGIQLNKERMYAISTDDVEICGIYNHAKANEIVRFDFEIKKTFYRDVLRKFMVVYSTKEQSEIIVESYINKFNEKPNGCHVNNDVMTIIKLFYESAFIVRIVTVTKDNKFKYIERFINYCDIEKNRKFYWVNYHPNYNYKFQIIN